MTIVISSKTQTKNFDKAVINVGSTEGCDFVLDIGQNFMLTLKYNKAEKKCVVINNFPCPKILFKGMPLGANVVFEKACKFMIAESDDFIAIKIAEPAPVPQPQVVQAQAPQFAEKTASDIAQEDFTESDLRGLYGSEVNAATRIKLEKRKSDLEKTRVSIVKQVSFAINDLKKKLSANFKASLFVHVAMFLSALVLAFGVSNYLLGLPINETANFLHLPTNIKMLFLFTLVIYGICLVTKQGVYQHLQVSKAPNQTSKMATNFMLGIGGLFALGFYVLNLVYYLQINVVFSVLLSFFFTALTFAFAMACGYFKNAGQNMSIMLDKYEYREDFEGVMNEYTVWIERYVNSISNTKLGNIKDKLFNLQIKSVGEILLGIATAPFLAYGVSNTLAMCFPEAAGWVRISGLRFSPVFLVLATFLIVFAFFAFVNAFLSIRKIQGSSVIKQDGFTNYLTHGVNIFGLEGIRKLEAEKTRSLVIGIAIIFIEFTMNTSYFMTEIGGDLSGMFLSLVAALVPTALLIAETYMLSQTKFDIYASDELISKIDRD